MKLDEKSIEWSIKHLMKFGDSDLFPNPVELQVLLDIIDDSVRKLKDVDLGNYNFGSARRFIVPKDEVSYRTATQLDPLDSVILTAIIYEYGKLIERRRTNIHQRKIFSYRFAPKSDLRLYNPDISWQQFWTECQTKAKLYSHAVYIDIADFYNQIYHHNIENQLNESAFPNQIKRWIMGLLESVTVKVSRGIPVGPHSTHLLGELSLIPIDNRLSMKGIDFCRYSDDIVIFCDDYKQSRIVLYEMAEMLDKQQRLIMQRQKTKIYESKAFIEHCTQMLQDRPINQAEEKILEILRNHTIDFYTEISIDDLSTDELQAFSAENIEQILSEYLEADEPNYARIRWLLRRLSQVRIPTAIEFCIKRIDDLTPAISDVCRYIAAVSDKYVGNWKQLGSSVLKLLKSDLIQSNEYLQVELLNLFSQNSELNQTSSLLSIYKSSPSNLKREILLSAYMMSLGDWVRELKEDYTTMELWNKRAFIIATSALPIEERKFFLEHIKDGNILNDLLIKWARASHHV